ncbi:hypothetical protein EVAR_4503_1 [Eumeta japonica]|uniref:Reverse transcriptase domain-containing protein n=1 Tax=Eumeta variegata TaxID=151549 RepID=A0A4C1T0X2_EUMVA|nr:hypothetical protein EVAR_4503_1 [Eumeta japonica]
MSLPLKVPPNSQPDSRHEDLVNRRRIRVWQLLTCMQTDISHLGMSALTRQDVLSEQEFLKDPLLYSAYTNDIPRSSSPGVQLALFADDIALFCESRNRSTRFTLLPLIGPLTS